MTTSIIVNRAAVVTAQADDFPEGETHGAFSRLVLRVAGGPTIELFFDAGPYARRLADAVNGASAAPQRDAA